MPKLTPELPLRKDKTQPGYQHISELRELVKQNMKMVILTNPGERVMMPDFGVGITGLLFENISDLDTIQFYEGRISKQISTYLPYVNVMGIAFDESEIDSNKVSVRISYEIPSLDEEDVLYV
tara:strand:+ start:2933 stop:3301 length:369 start_codon:yes stop_codon:yes gene_type:complete